MREPFKSELFSFVWGVYGNLVFLYERDGIRIGSFDIWSVRFLLMCL